jgi:hypothetical protein
LVICNTAWAHISTWPISCIIIVLAAHRRTWKDYRSCIGSTAQVSGDEDLRFLEETTSVRNQNLISFQSLQCFVRGSTLKSQGSAPRAQLHFRRSRGFETADWTSGPLQDVPSSLCSLPYHSTLPRILASWQPPVWPRSCRILTAKERAGNLEMDVAA